MFSLFQTLADMFPFNISQFLDEGDEESTSQDKALVTDDFRARQLDIADRLGSSLDALVSNSELIRSIFHNIQTQLQDNLAEC
jgi:hypothetical protein